MFRTKKDAMDHILRYKTRLVAKVYSQVVRVDFNETFALMAKFTTLRIIITIGVAIDLETH